MVDLIINDTFDEIGDITEDEELNVLDIVALVDLILDGGDSDLII